jgi:hypothetical protein
VIESWVSAVEYSSATKIMTWLMRYTTERQRETPELEGPGVL